MSVDDRRLENYFLAPSKIRILKGSSQAETIFSSSSSFTAQLIKLITSDFKEDRLTDFFLLFRTKIGNVQVENCSDKNY